MDNERIREKKLFSQKRYIKRPTGWPKKVIHYHVSSLNRIKNKCKSIAVAVQHYGEIQVEGFSVKEVN